MNVTDFEQRRNEILEAVIEAYITTASPVGSELIARKLRQTLSPATIRNVMAELEEEGLLIQPHTSAGRVPTDRGYRYYVDILMNVIRLSPDERHQLEERIRPEEQDVEQLLARTSRLLAEASHQAAFVIAPTVKQSTVKQVELVPLSSRRILCVLVSHEGLVASHVVEVVESIHRDEVAALYRFINSELIGRLFLEVDALLQHHVLSPSDSVYHLAKRAQEILHQALMTEPMEQFFLDGTSYLFEQPEFRDHPQQAHELLRALDAQEALVGPLRADLTTRGLRVRIGREVPIAGLQECSSITSTFQIADKTLGALGVLGPKRMGYPRMRAIVEGMADLVSTVLNQWESESDA